MIGTWKRRQFFCGCLLLLTIMLIIKISSDAKNMVINMEFSSYYIGDFKREILISNVVKDGCFWNDTYKNLMKEKVRRQVYKTVRSMQSKLLNVLSPRILRTLTRNSFLCSKVKTENYIDSEDFMNLVKNETISTLHKLSTETAEKYPSMLNTRGISRQILSELKLVVDKKPMNKYPYSYVFNPNNICTKKEIYLLVVVKSFVKHYRSRHVLRKTWIKDLKKLKNSTAVVFTLGYAYRERYMVEDEYLTHGDVIQGSFNDAYRNNTLKMMMAFEWVTWNCSNARFIFFVDDDLIVNVRSTINFLSSVSNKIEENLYSGMPVIGGLPERNKESKWFIDRKTYPYPVFPEYLAGCAIFMSQNVVQSIHAVIPYVRYFPFDDVYIGIIANKLGIPLHNNELLTKVNIRNLKTLTKAIANHGFQDEEFLYETYKNISERR